MRKSVAQGAHLWGVKKLIYLVVGVGVAALLVWAVRHRLEEPDMRSRKVAFDNTYKGATTLRVHVKVDDGWEQSVSATCDSKTCTFPLPMTDGIHQVTLAVEQDGVRGTSGRFTLDTSTIP